MQTSEVETCQSCSLVLLDLGEELACPGCGMVKEKTVLEAFDRSEGKLPIFGSQPLGSFMGSKGVTNRERGSRVSGERTSYMKMKLISDHATREGSSADCGRLVERVGEKLFLPRVVILQAAAIARKTMAAPHRGRRLLVADVSAYALVAACKVEGVSSVSIREILNACSDFGRTVSSSSIFNLMLGSEVRTFARRPEDYLPKVIGRLSMNGRLQLRLAKDGIQAASYFNSLREVAVEMLEACDGTVLCGRRPCALAASAVYAAEALMASRESRNRRLTQRECSECGDSAEYTVREQCSTIFNPLVSALASRPRPTLTLRGAR